MFLDRAYLLLLLVPLVPAILAAARWGRSALSPARRRWSTGVRLGLGTLLVFALAAPAFRVANAVPRAVFYLVDVSDSVPVAARESALSAIASLARQADPGAEQWVIVFAGAAEARRLGDPAGVGTEDGLRELLLFPRAEAEARRVLERAAGPERGRAEADLQRLRALRAALDPQETDPAAAVRALGRCPASGPSPAVFLFTDGRFTRPFPPSDWTALRDASSDVAWVRVGGEGDAGIEVASLSAPPAVDAGQPFDAILRVRSPATGAASLRVLIDGRPGEARPLSLPAGTRAVTLPGLRIEEPGLHRVTAVVEAEGDPEPRNNVGSVLVHVGGLPEVLVVEGAPGLAAHFTSALGAQKIHAERVDPAHVPARQEEVARYGTVALVGVASDQLSAAAAEALAGAVEKEEVGLLFCGGPHLGGARSWRGRPAERLLPVSFLPFESPPPAGPGGGAPAVSSAPGGGAGASKAVDADLSAIALLLLIDKSASMAGNNIRLAREAAIAAAEKLEEGDVVGVIAFDVEPKPVLEPTAASRKEFIRDRIARIQADGGTDLYPALDMARRVLQGSRAQVRHVLVLSDGMTPLADFKGLVQQMTAAQITVSAVCAASDLEYNLPLMSNLATWGRGRIYPVWRFDEVPQVFVRETAHLLGERDKERAARRPQGTRPGTPPAAAPGPAGGGEVALRVVQPVEALSGFDKEPLPPAGGLLPAAAREAAVTAVAAGDGAPALVIGRAGLGRTAAWLADWSDAWGRRWIGWDRFPAFAAQLVRSLHRRDAVERFPGGVAAGISGASVQVAVEFREAAERWPGTAANVAAFWRSEGGDEDHPIALRQAGAAAAAGEFPAPAPGAGAVVFARLRAGPRTWTSVPVGVVRPYPEEFRRAPEESARQASAAAAAGVRVIESGAAPEMPPAPLAAGAGRVVSLAGPLLVAALLLLPVDVALRRVQW